MTRPDAAAVTHDAHRDARRGDAPATEPVTKSVASTDSQPQIGDADGAAQVTRRDAARVKRTHDAPAVPRRNSGTGGDAAAVAQTDLVPRRSAVTQITDTAQRDAEIVWRATDGASSREIAQAMGLSPSTVQRVIRRTTATSSA